MTLQESISQIQSLLSQVRQNPQFQSLQVDCDVTLGDVLQYLNTLQWEAAAVQVDTTAREGFSQ